VSGLTIRVEPASGSAATAVTDAQGRYTVGEVPPGRVTVLVVLEGAGIDVQSPSREATVPSGGSATVDFTGSWVRTARITGRVLVNGSGLPGLAVSATGPESGATTTGVDGDFVFGQLRSGVYTVTIDPADSGADFESTSSEVSVGVGQSAAVEFTGTLQVAATASIDFIEDVNTGARIFFGGLRGNLEVLVSVDPGTDRITSLRLTLGGEVVGELQVDPDVVDWSQRLRVPLNTLEVDLETGEPVIDNGDGVLGLQLLTEDGQIREPDTAQVTVANRDRVGGVAFLTGMEDEGVVARGRRWWGNRELRFRAVPIVYSPDINVGSVELRAISSPSANGGAGLDFGSGPGVAHIVTAPDFIATATLADNREVVEDRAAGPGHRIVITRVFDENGVEIGDRVDHSATLTGLYFDFVGPRPGGAAEIFIAGGGVVAGAWYSTGVLSLSGVVEGGVGLADVVFEAYAGSQIIDPDFSDVFELDERQIEVQVRVTRMVDLLGNEGDDTLVPTTIPIGVDKTPIAIMSPLPLLAGRTINPDDDAGDGIADNRLQFTLTEPILDDGSPGSGLGSLELTGEDELGNPQDLTAQIAPGVLGANTVDISGLPDGRYVLDLDVEDAARAPNASAWKFDFIVDSQAPDITLVNAPSGSITLTSQAAGFTLAGQITDLAGVQIARVVVRSDGGNGVCDLADPELAVGAGAGEVDRNNVTIGQVDSFSHEIQVNNLGAGLTQTVCFWIEADDKVEGTDGKPEPNEARTSVRTVINWQ